MIMSVKNTSWSIVCWPGLARSETNSLKPKWPIIATNDRCQLLFPTPKQDTVSLRCTTGCRKMCKNWNSIFIINMVSIFFLVIARFRIKIVFAIIRICCNRQNVCVCPWIISCKASGFGTSQEKSEILQMKTIQPFLPKMGVTQLFHLGFQRWVLIVENSVNIHLLFLLLFLPFNYSFWNGE